MISRLRFVREEPLDWALLKAHYGNLASVLGLVVSVVGFSFTLWQVRKTRTASEKAQAMAREAIERVSSRLFFNQIAVALRLAEEVASFCQATQWHRAFDRCEQLRVALAGVVDDPMLLGNESLGLIKSIDDVALIMQELERINQGKRSPAVSHGKMEILNRIVISLSRIEARIRRAALEV